MKILLIIIFILIMLLIIPTVLYVSYSNENGFIIHLRYIFKFKLYPKNHKKNKKKKKSKQKQMQKKEPEIEKKKTSFKDIKDTISLVLALAKAVKKPILKFLKRINIQILFLEICVSKEDAAQTAIGYGKMMAYCNGAYAALSNFFKIKLKKILIYPNYNKQEDELDFQFNMKISVSLFFVFALAFTSFGRGIKAFLKNMAAKKQNPDKKLNENKD